MKLCVCSDSHGNRDGLKKMLDIEKPDGLLFCGDGCDDFYGVTLPGVTFFVAGNCDFFSHEPIKRELSLEGVKLIMTHGHRFSVKTTVDPLLNEALGSDARVAVYGHSHRQSAEYKAGVLLLNGGTMSRFNEYYAVLYLEKGEVRYELKRLI